MTEELKPCPFCGGKPLAYDMLESLSICTVECSGCDITVEGRTTEAAATKWNTRALTTSQPAQAGEVDAKCQTCNGHGLVGGHMQDGSGYGEGCPDCNPEPAPLVKWASTQPAAQATPEPSFDTNPLRELLQRIEGRYRAAMDTAYCQGSEAHRSQLRAARDSVVAAEAYLDAVDLIANTQQATPEPVGEVPHVKLLIEAIGTAAQKAGIYNGQVPLTGPLALMLLGDMATCAATHPAPGVPEGWHAALLRLRKDENSGDTVFRCGFNAGLDAALAAAQAKGSDK